MFCFARCWIFFVHKGSVFWIRCGVQPPAKSHVALNKMATRFEGWLFIQVLMFSTSPIQTKTTNPQPIVLMIPMLILRRVLTMCVFQAEFNAVFALRSHCVGSKPSPSNRHKRKPNKVPTPTHTASRASFGDHAVRATTTTKKPMIMSTLDGKGLCLVDVTSCFPFWRHL